MKDLNPRKLFLYLLIASVSASAVIGIAVILFGDFGDFETRVLLTALTVSATSVLGLACGAYIELRNARLIPTVGIISAAVSAALWIVLIWQSGCRTMRSSER